MDGSFFVDLDLETSSVTSFCNPMWMVDDKTTNLFTSLTSINFTVNFFPPTPPTPQSQGQDSL